MSFCSVAGYSLTGTFTRPKLTARSRSLALAWEVLIPEAPGSSHRIARGWDRAAVRMTLRDWSPTPPVLRAADAPMGPVSFTDCLLAVLLSSAAGSAIVALLESCDQLSPDRT